jgi:hypothetical protein
VRKCVRWFAIAAALLVPSGAVAQVQVNQTFIPQGPSPKFGPIDVVQSGDAPPNGTVAGAVQTILLDPSARKRCSSAESTAASGARPTAGRRGRR